MIPALAAVCASLLSVSGYYAQPALHGDTLVFASAGDLWIAQVPADGSQALAHRLTSAPGVESRPVFSPDGKFVAYTGMFDGNAEAFVIPVSGGTPTRLTVHPGRDLPIAWTPDGKSVLVRSDRTNPHGDFELFTVPAAGGRLERLPFREGMLGSFNRSTGALAFNPTSNESWYWKGYRGGTAPEIWVTDKSFKEYKRLTDTPENELFPMWVGERIYFLADSDGRMNIWSMNGDGSDRTKHTNAAAKDFDIRWPSADSAGTPRIVYAQGGQLYLYDGQAKSSRALDVALQGDRLQDRVRVEPVTPTLTELALSVDGKRLAAVSRGEVVVGPVGKPKAGVQQSWLQLPGRSASREVGAAWGPDGTLFMVSDKGGEASIATCDVDAVMKGEADAFTTLAQSDRWLMPPEVSPDGKFVAFSDKSLRMRMLDTHTRAEREIGKSPAGEITDYKFSPDSRWLAWVALLPTGFGQIHLYDTRAAVDRTISTGLTDDRFPRWDPNGKFLYFASARAINPMLDQFDMAFTTRDAWEFFALPLSASQAPPVEPAAASAGFDMKKWAEAPPVKSDKDEGDEESDEGEDSKHVAKNAEGDTPDTGKDKDNGKDKDKDSGTSKSKDGATAEVEGEGEAPHAVEIEFNGLMSRAAKLPVEPGTFREVNAIYGGLLYLRVPGQGVADEIWPPPVLGVPGATLERVELAEGKAKPLVEHPVDTYSLSGDARTVVVASTGGGGDSKSGGAGGAAGASSGLAVQAISLAEPGEPVPVPIGGVELAVDISQEWAQIFDEAWRLQRDFFWKPDLGGVDWKAVKARYAALLPRIGTRAELNDLVGDMCGELGTSHTYIGGGDDYQTHSPSSIGQLGLDVSPDAEGFRIDAILPDQSAVGGDESPLAAPHRGVRVGDVIIAIDGKSAAGVNELGELLRGRAGKEVQLAVRSTDGTTRVVETPAIRSETELRYADWVERNRRAVLEKSGGRLGYMHLPDMDSAGLIAFVRSFYPQYLMDGVIVDERWNGGGYVSQMVLEHLRRKQIASDVPREGAPATYPQRVATGPMVVLINEQAGSDGDIFPTGFKLYGIGPLIGTRTWGGVVGIRSDKPFVDGGQATQPEFAYWDPVVGFKMENHGVDPDIKVELTPADIAAGRDPQLDRAIAELMPKVEKNTPMKPPVPTKENTTVPPAAR